MSRCWRALANGTTAWAGFVAFFRPSRGSLSAIWRQAEKTTTRMRNSPPLTSPRCPWLRGTCRGAGGRGTAARRTTGRCNNNAGPAFMAGVSCPGVNTPLRWCAHMLSRRGAETAQKPTKPRPPLAPFWMAFFWRARVCARSMAGRWSSDDAARRGGRSEEGHRRPSAVHTRPPPARPTTIIEGMIRHAASPRAVTGRRQSRGWLLLASSITHPSPGGALQGASSGGRARRRLPQPGRRSTPRSPVSEHLLVVSRVGVGVGVGVGVVVATTSLLPLVLVLALVAVRRSSRLLGASRRRRRRRLAAAVARGHSAGASTHSVEKKKKRQRGSACLLDADSVERTCARRSRGRADDEEEGCREEEEGCLCAYSVERKSATPARIQVAGSSRHGSWISISSFSRDGVM